MRFPTYALRTRFLAAFRRAVTLVLALVGAVGAHAEQVRLAWDPNGESDLAGYRIYYGTHPGSFANSLDTGMAAEGTITGLQWDTEYYFAVTAYNVSGFESEPSAPIAYRTPRNPNPDPDPDPNPDPDPSVVFLKRSFSGIFGEGTGQDAGSFSANLTVFGAASGRVVVNGKSYSWKGYFDESGEMRAEIVDRAKSLVGILTLELKGESHEITGSIETVAGTTDVQAASTPTGVSIDPRVGRYTLALSDVGSVEGQGYGYGVLVVNRRGVSTMSGVFPNGKRFAASAPIDAEGTVPFYRYQAAMGSQLGRLTFRDVAGFSDADGQIWLRETSGAEHTLTVQAARFAGWKVLAASPTEPTFTIRATHPVFGIVQADAAGPATLVGTRVDGVQLSVRISPETGLFTGRCSYMGTKFFSYSGAAYQKPGFGGFGGITPGTGGVELLTLSE